MKRYPAFDPPEYVNWVPDPEAMARFRARVPAQLPDHATLVRLYAGMLRNRLHDIALKRWVRQGVISKAWLGTGEEAVAIGNVHALDKGDVIGPMIRNAGACHEMGMPVVELLKVYLGTPDTITRGRDLHTGDPEHGVIPPISFVAALTPVFAGLALSFKMKGQPHVALTWVGDGARWTGEFHEGINFAAVKELPLVIVLQDNQVALGTHKEVHSRAECAQMAEGYGLTGLTCDGNNILDVHAVSKQAVALCREGKGPVILTATTFRMGGHATHDEAEARDLFSPETFAWWGKRDPIGVYETWLVEESARTGVDQALLSRVEAEVTREIEEAAEAALASRRQTTATEHDVMHGLYADDDATGATRAVPTVAGMR